MKYRIKEAAIYGFNAKTGYFPQVKKGLFWKHISTYWICGSPLHKRTVYGKEWDQGYDRSEAREIINLAQLQGCVFSRRKLLDAEITNAFKNLEKLSGVL